MASSSSYAFIFLLFLHHLTPAQGVGEELIYEDGYTVTTVLDGDRSNLKVNPHSIHRRYPPSDLFILLDSVASTFYTVSLSSISNQTVIKKLTGDGEPGYLDGNLDSARFNKPKSFAVDYNGNVYVADQRKRTIRKITNAGVTTIAGGFSQKAGRKDGAGRDASFSDDFELTFIPQRCALMISDHGNRLVCEINLKEDDCASHSGSLLGTTSAWVSGLVLSSLLGLIIGLLIRPYLIPYEGRRPLQSSWTWTHCLMKLETQIVMLCYGIRSAVVNLKTALSLSRQMIVLTLSQLSLILSPRTMNSHGTHEKTVSLMDMDDLCSNNSNSNSNTSINNVMDLLAFGGGEMVPAKGLEKQEQEGESVDVSLGEHNKIDGMIMENLRNFEEKGPKVCLSESVDFAFSGLVKRR